MQAIRVHQFGGPEVLKLEELPTPVPGPGQAVVRVHAAGVNPVETYLRAGNYPTNPPLPWTPGSDAAGVVESVGSGVTKFKPGDRVYTCRSISGTYATHALVDAASQLQPLPDSVSFVAGAGIFVPYYTAYQAAFHRGNVLPGDTVLIHGASGGVGLAALQWLANTGVTLLATAGSPAGLDLLRKNGAHHVFNHRDPGYLDTLRAAAPSGVDVILEMLANVNLAADLTLLAPFGRVVIIGNRGEITLNPRLTMGKDADIRGMQLFNATPRQFDRMHAAVASGLASGRLAPITAHQLPLAQAPRAHELVYEPGATGKIVLLP